jgi:hypothetical protein
MIRRTTGLRRVVLAGALFLLLLLALLVQGEAHAKKIEGLEALEEKPDLDVEARLHVLWTIGDLGDEPVHEFLVDMARIKFTWTQWKIVEAELKLDVDELIDGDGDANLLRDVYVRVQPASWLGVQIGQFKRPFSRLELISRKKLPLIHRGEANEWMVEHLAFGERDIGIQIDGRLVEAVDLDYSIGLFNGAGPNTREIDLYGFKDLSFRVQVEPHDAVKLGMSFSFKHVAEGDIPRFADEEAFEYVDPGRYPWGYRMEDFVEEYGWLAGASWMTGLDVGLRFGGARVLLDTTLGESWWFSGSDLTWAAALVVSWERALPTSVPMALEPVVMLEAILPRLDRPGQRLWRAVPGLNVHLGEYFRLMIDAELVLPQGREPDETTRDGLWPGEWPGEWRRSSRVLVQLAFDI